MLEIAKSAALAAGEIQMNNYGKKLNVDEKLKNDIKLEVDKLSEKAIVDIILSTYPNHSILAEEGGITDNGSEYTWIIDPLDGTVNYFYGIPYFCTSIACIKINKNRAKPAKCFADLGDPVCAAIYAGSTRELIYAEAGKGAYLNDKQIFASKESKLKESFLTTGFGHTKESYKNMFKNSMTLGEQVRKIRCMGAAAYDIANVACGRFTCFFENAIHSWDIAAGAIIAQEAGAAVDAIELEDGRWDVIISSPNIIDDVKKIIHNI